MNESVEMMVDRKSVSCLPTKLSEEFKDGMQLGILCLLKDSSLNRECSV